MVEKRVDRSGPSSILAGQEALRWQELLELGLGKAHKSLAKKNLKHTTQSSIT